MKKSPRRPKSLNALRNPFLGIQLQSRIRKNDDTDDLLEDFLENPLDLLRKVWDAHIGRASRPAGDNINNLYTTGDSVSNIYNFTLCIQTLFTGTTYGIPPDNFLPTELQLAQDLMKHIKDFILATVKGTKGGTNLTGRSDAATRAWVKKYPTIS